MAKGFIRSIFQKLSRRAIGPAMAAMLAAAAPQAALAETPTDLSFGALQGTDLGLRGTIDAFGPREPLAGWQWLPGTYDGSLPLRDWTWMPESSKADMWDTAFAPERFGTRAMPFLNDGTTFDPFKVFGPTSFLTPVDPAVKREQLLKSAAEFIGADPRRERRMGRTLKAAQDGNAQAIKDLAVAFLWKYDQKELGRDLMQTAADMGNRQAIRDLPEVFKAFPQLAKVEEVAAPVLPLSMGEPVPTTEELQIAKDRATAIVAAEMTIKADTRRANRYDTLLAAAKEGDAGALNTLGQRLLWTFKKPEIARGLFTASAALGNAEATANLAYMDKNARGIANYVAGLVAPEPKPVVRTAVRTPVKRDTAVVVPEEREAEAPAVTETEGGRIAATCTVTNTRSGAYTCEENADRIRKGERIVIRFNQDGAVRKVAATYESSQPILTRQFTAAVLHTRPWLSAVLRRDRAAALTP